MEFGDYVIETIRNDDGEYIGRVSRKDGRHFIDGTLFPFEVLPYAETRPRSTEEEALQEAKAIAAESKATRR
jgi:hypothetical protein